MPLQGNKKRCQPGKARGQNRYAAVKLEFDRKALQHGAWFEVSGTWNQTIQRPPGQVLGLQDMIPKTGCSGDIVHWLEGDEATSNYTADYQSTHGAKKKESTVKYLNKSAPVVTIAHFIKVPQQQLDDAPALTGDIDNRLIVGLDRKLATGDTIIDEARKAQVQIAAAGFTPTGYVFSPSAWEQVSGAKNDSGDYIAGSPGAPRTGAARELWDNQGPATTTFQGGGGELLSQ
jgi:hypothetical protein